ncbi:MAG: VWA domain-containing protein [Actinomycetota bacterium]
MSIAWTGPGRRRSVLRTALLTATTAAALAWTAAAQASITVNVVTGAGTPIAGQNVTLRDAGDGFVDSGSTNAQGQVVFPSPNATNDPAPYTAKVTSLMDDCRQFPDSQREGSVGGLNDGAVVVLSIDVTVFCADTSPSSSLPPATGAVDGPNRRVVALPGGTADLDLLLPFSASNVVVSAAGTPLNTPGTGDSVRITAPAGGYEGVLVLSYTVDGQQGSYELGTLTSRAVAPPVRLPGPIDIEAIIDVSGSMAGTDPRYIRRDAVNLLADLARPGDMLGAAGFDDQSKPIFPLTSITGAPAVVAGLKAAARKAIVNDGSTNYNIGMADAFTALTTTAGVDPQRQKALIFLTDGGHNAGAYTNGHLLFAFNASGRSWPVCAVQLGPKRSFQPADVARLKRIASETGGQYFATEQASDLTDIYNRCFNLSTGQRTIANKTFTFTPRQKKQFTQPIAKGLPQATFFANWGNGLYRLVLTDPRGKQHTSGRPGKGFTFRHGATFAFFRVNKPLPGVWTVQLVNVKLPTPTDRARTSITAPKKK